MFMYVQHQQYLILDAHQKIRHTITLERFRYDGYESSIIGEKNT